MINNDAELEAVRGQLAHIDAAIEDLRRNVLPKSESMFKLLTEAPLEMRQSLQADIDAYLRTTTVLANGTRVNKEPTDTKSLQPARDDRAGSEQTT
jgi:hypothetical protein